MTKSKSLQLETNINCASCYEKVNIAFKGKELIDNFEVDFSDPNRKAVFYLRENASEEEVIKTVESTGYEAKRPGKKNFFKKIFNSS